MTDPEAPALRSRTGTGRIRWQPLSNGDTLGYVTPGQWLYEICKPSDDADDDELELRSRLPGQTGDRWQGTDRGELEEEAEEMLAQFVTSLGVIFPEAVLKLADALTAPAVAADCLDEEMAEVRRECGERVREVITRALNGETDA